MKIKAIIHQAEEGGYWAEVPIFQGCYTQGETIEEVLENLKEVITRINNHWIIHIYYFSISSITLLT